MVPVDSYSFNSPHAEKNSGSLPSGQGAPLLRSARDSIFRSLFSRAEYALKLYKELHPEDADAREEDIRIVTIQNMIASGIYNDLGFVARGKLLVLAEAQTEWNDNITMRLLLYLAETYRRLIVENPDFSMHANRRAALPKPELIVIYSGDASMPGEVSLAHDFFGDAECAVDLRARVISAPGEGIVGQFVRASKLIGTIAREEGEPGKKSKKFVDTCIEQGILVEYMEECKAEVTDMMFTLFDEEEATRRYVRSCVKEAREEAIEEGLAEGRAKGLAEGREEGRAEGRAEGNAEAVAALMENLGMTEQEARKALNLSEKNPA